MHDADIMHILIHIYVMIIQVLFSFGEVVLSSAGSHRLQVAYIEHSNVSDESIYQYINIIMYQYFAVYFNFILMNISINSTIRCYICMVNCNFSITVTTL